MTLTLHEKSLQDRPAWQSAGFRLPEFDREQVRKNTVKHPKWIHFGAGNIFKAFPAHMQQNLLNAGKSDTGIIVAEGYDYEIVEKMCRPHDDLSILVTLKSDGSIEKTVIASVVESLTINPENTQDWKRLKEIFTASSLQMVSFTITEKGYSLVDAQGGYMAAVKEDFEKGPQAPKSYIGKLAALLYERYRTNQAPIALVSMDNCSHNGDKLYNAVNAFAQQWGKNGIVDAGFEAYINDRDAVSFPWSMIDKITPRPDDSVKKMLTEAGFVDVDAVVTTKNTYVAPFVNAEETEYLVIEDWFPNGRPNLEEGGAIFTDRQTVDKVEKMKVCTCLNPLHTALAIFGCLLGYTLIADEMKDRQLVKLVETIGYQEGLPVVVDPGILNPKEFLDTVLRVRFPNPFMPDTPQRIATDTSQKLGIRFGGTIKAYTNTDGKTVSDLKLIPLVLAGWCRYLMGIDDEGKRFTVSPDPLYDTVSRYVANIQLGDGGPFHDVLEPIFSDAAIFGVNLYEAGLGTLAEQYFEEMVAGTGAVRKTLEKYTEN